MATGCAVPIQGLGLLETDEEFDQAPGGGGLCGWSTVFGAVEPTSIDHARSIFSSGCTSSYEGLLCDDVTSELFDVFAEQDGGAPFKDQLSGRHAMFCKSLSELILSSQDHLKDPDARQGHQESLVALHRRAGASGSQMTSLDNTVARKGRRRSPAPPPPPPPPTTTATTTTTTTQWSTTASGWFVDAQISSSDACLAAAWNAKCGRSNAETRWQLDDPGAPEEAPAPTAAPSEKEDAYYSYYGNDSDDSYYSYY